MRRTGVLLAATITAVVAVSVALASTAGVGKKTIGGRDFATDVIVSFTAPKGYRIDTENGYGGWKGPPVTNLDINSQVESGLQFDVHTAVTRSVERAARDKIGTDFGGIPTKQVVGGPIGVPHMIRGRKVGVIKGFFLIRQGARQGYEGWTNSAVAFSLGRGYPVLAANVDTTAPGSDANLSIKGMLPSAWNRQVVEQGVRGIVVEGNLAPRTMTARAQAGRVVGRVTDSLGHPLVGVKVKLRKADLQPCCNATTTATGAFTLNVPQSAGTGSFQLSVAVGGATLTKSVRIG